MRKTRSVRIGENSREFLRAYALVNEISIGDALTTILNAVEKSESIEIFIRHCTTCGEDFYTATFGRGRNDFYRGDSETGAEKAVRDFLRANGFNPRRFKLLRERQDFDWRTGDSNHVLDKMAARPRGIIKLAVKSAGKVDSAANAAVGAKRGVQETLPCR